MLSPLPQENEGNESAEQIVSDVQAFLSSPDHTDEEKESLKTQLGEIISQSGSQESASMQGSGFKKGGMIHMTQVEVEAKKKREMQQKASMPRNMMKGGKAGC